FVRVRAAPERHRLRVRERRTRRPHDRVRRPPARTLRRPRGRTRRPLPAPERAGLLGRAAPGLVRVTHVSHRRGLDDVSAPDDWRAPQRIGPRGPQVTGLGRGTAPIGNMFTSVRDDDAAATVDAAWTGGIRYFDTAPLYGHGQSERRLGRALCN